MDTDELKINKSHREILSRLVRKGGTRTTWFNERPLQDLWDNEMVEVSKGFIVTITDLGRESL